MTSQVETLVRAAVQMDKSITPAMLDRALAALRGERPEPPPQSEVNILRANKILKVKDVIEAMGISRSQVYEMLRTGQLKRVYATGTRRGIGITPKSFLRVAQGRIDRGREM